MPPRAPRSKKGSGKSKPSKGKATVKVNSAEPVRTTPSTRNRSRFEPYQRAEPTPEPEENLPADPRDLESLDATAKELYAMDRETLKYIEDLNHRTATLLELVNRNESQLRAANAAIGRIEGFVRSWQRMDDHWTLPQLVGNESFRAKWENNKIVILGPNESSNLENDDRWVVFSFFWVDFTLHPTGIPICSLPWFVVSEGPSLLSKSIFPSMLTWIPEFLEL